MSLHHSWRKRGCSFLSPLARRPGFQVALCSFPLPLFASFSLNPCGGGRKEGTWASSLPKPNAPETTPWGSETGLCRPRSHRKCVGAGKLERFSEHHSGVSQAGGFLPRGAGAWGCVAGRVSGGRTHALCWLWMHLVMQQVCCCVGSCVLNEASRQILGLPALLSDVTTEMAVLCHGCGHADTGGGMTGRATLRA